MISTQRRLEYAVGYLALGLIDDASNELEAIEGEDRLSAEVMGVRMDLYMQAKQWDLLLAVARQFAHLRPAKQQGWISWAYALRAMNRIEEAKAVLLQAEPRHGKKCGILHYNLACYYCLLNEMTEAKRRLSVACGMDMAWKEAALDDSDLKAMWTDIASMK